MIDDRSRNPFPFQGTLSMEGSAQHAFAASDVTLPTIEREPIQRAWGHVQDYLRRFDRTAASTGQVVALRGPHGSGKTHTIHVLFDRVVEWAGTQDKPKPFQIYVKAEGPDFVRLYQEAVTAIPESLLKELSLRFLASLVDRELATGSSNSSRDARKELEADPHRVLGLFDQYLVEKGKAEELQAAEVQRVAGGVKDFHRVLGYLLSRDLASAAYEWLLNRQVSPELMRRLGVAGPISSPTVAKWALQLLVTMFTSSGYPLVIYIDQYEKLVLEGGAAHAQNVGLLHSLVEFIPRESGMLLMSGNVDAWESLPRDFKQRFTSNIVDFPILAYGEANLLIRTYLASRDATFSLDDRSSNGLEPFSDGAVREVTKFSAGNVRRFLQLSALVWQKATDAQRDADARLVRDVIRESERRRYFDERSVRDAIGALLREGDWRFSEEVASGQREVDFLVSSRSGLPLIAIDVKESFFHLDEATKALETLETRSALAASLPVTRYMLVVLGYISPEIVSRIEAVVDELIVYDNESFGERFKAVIAKLDTQSAAATVPFEDGGLRQQIDHMREALSKIAESRAVDIQVIETRIASLLDRQTTDRFADRRQLAREAWAEERRKIEEGMRAARRQRRIDQTVELQRLSEAALERLRTRWRVLCMALMLVPVALVVVFLGDALSSGADTSYESLRTVRFAAKMLAIAVAITCAVVAFVRWPTFILQTLLPVSYPLKAVPGSIENLDATARAFNARSGARAASLWSSFPQERYAAAIHPRLAVKPDLLEALAGEQSAVVRGAMARAIGAARADPTMTDLVERFLREPTTAPERGYAVGAVAHAGQPMSEAMYQWPGRLRTLAVLSGVLSVPSGTLPQELASGLMSMSGSEPPQHQRLLAEAFHRGADRVEWPLATLGIGQAHIDLAIAELSPFDATGLGALDELPNIQIIDQMYLFFRHVGFLFERDLLNRIEREG